MPNNVVWFRCRHIDGLHILVIYPLLDCFKKYTEITKIGKMLIDSVFLEKSEILKGMVEDTFRNRNVGSKSCLEFPSSVFVLYFEEVVLI